MLTTGMKAPDFTLTDKDGKAVSLSDFIGKKVVLYFYPKFTFLQQKTSMLASSTFFFLCYLLFFLEIVSVVSTRISTVVC